jgi:hypothetical protein
VILQFLGADTPGRGHPRSRERSIFDPRAWTRCADQGPHDSDVGPEVREWRTRELGMQDPDAYFLTVTDRPRQVDLSRANDLTS